MDKSCSACGVRKTADQFYAYAHSKDGLRGKCKSCMNAAEKARYQRTRQKRILQTRSRQQERHDFLLAYLLEHPCVDCGETDPVVLEFDHVRGKKVAGISRLVRSGTLQRVKDELAKCDVRCANCHRKVTASRGKHWSWVATRTEPLHTD